MPGTELALISLFSLLGGMLGGILASGYRILHLEMEWHQIRTDLRKYYTRMRNDRALLETGPRREQSLEDQIADIRKRNPQLSIRGE